MKINTEKRKIMKITKSTGPVEVFVGNNKIKHMKEL
jgi:hypothetical protein